MLQSKETTTGEEQSQSFEESIVKLFLRLWDLCPAYQNYSKNTSATHPGGHKRTKKTSKELQA